MPTELTPREAIIKLNRIRTNTDERPPEIDMAIKAINRQFVKRKPTPYFEGGVECPVCGTTVGDNDTEHYCFSCGQALDWSEPKCKT